MPRARDGLITLKSQRSVVSRRRTTLLTFITFQESSNVSSQSEVEESEDKERQREMGPLAIYLTAKPTAPYLFYLFDSIDTLPYPSISSIMKRRYIGSKKQPKRRLKRDVSRHGNSRSAISFALFRKRTSFSKRAFERKTLAFVPITLQLYTQKGFLDK